MYAVHYPKEACTHVAHCLTGGSAYDGHCLCWMFLVLCTSVRRVNVSSALPPWHGGCMYAERFLIVGCWTSAIHCPIGPGTHVVHTLVGDCTGAVCSLIGSFTHAMHCLIEGCMDAVNRPLRGCTYSVHRWDRMRVCVLSLTQFGEEKLFFLYFVPILPAFHWFDLFCLENSSQQNTTCRMQTSWERSMRMLTYSLVCYSLFTHILQTNLQLEWWEIDLHDVHFCSISSSWLWKPLPAITYIP